MESFEFPKLCHVVFGSVYKLELSIFALYPGVRRIYNCEGGLRIWNAPNHILSAMKLMNSVCYFQKLLLTDVKRKENLGS